MNKKYIKSPLNYVGGKYKLLPQIEPLFPQADTFVDLMCGGFNVGVNARANFVIGNDIEDKVIQLLDMFKNYSSDYIISQIENIVNEYGLSDTSKKGYEFYGCNSSDGVAKYNKEKYLKMRTDYNNNQDDVFLFYTVVIFAFNNQIRFNSKGEFNMPVNKRDFNNNIRKNIIKFGDEIHKKEITFTNNDFRELKPSKLTTNDFVYLDPPYLLGCASYNEQDGWNLDLEKDMYQLCDDLNNKNIKFAMSNVVKHKGKINEYLENWGGKYNINFLDFDYKNCNYHSNNKNNETIEVLITNYNINK